MSVFLVLILFLLSFIVESNQHQYEEVAYPPSEATLKEFTFDLQQLYHNPDGYYRSVFHINGQSPGPAIVADEGDWIKVIVNNYLPVSMSIHFHGILQRGTPWSDGVTGVTQYPIAPGDSYTYIFQLIDQCGATWYHAHHRGYASDGIIGPIFIIPNSKRERPYKQVVEDETSIVLITELEKNPINIFADDWLKLPMDDIISRMFTFGIDPVCIQSILINGRGRITCNSLYDIEEVLERANSNREPSK